jgi:hypothetical protein
MIKDALRLTISCHIFEVFPSQENRENRRQNRKNQWIITINCSIVLLDMFEPTSHPWVFSSYSQSYDAERNWRLIMINRNDNRALNRDYSPIFCHHDFANISRLHKDAKVVQTYSESETPDCFSVIFPSNYFEFFIRRKIYVTFFIKADRIIFRVCMNLFSVQLGCIHYVYWRCKTEIFRRNRIFFKFPRLIAIIVSINHRFFAIFMT